MEDKRVVCLNCMDGRTQLPVIHWIKDEYGVDNVDMVTEAGMDGLLANQESNIDPVLNKINISIDKNNAQKIFVVGHADCKGNPVDNDVHHQNIESAVSRIQSEFVGLDVVGLWVTDQWAVEKI